MSVEPISLATNGSARQVVTNNDQLTPFAGEPPAIYLTDKERSTLQQDRAIYKTVATLNGEQLVIVFKIDAQASDIWSTIKSFSQYSNWIKEVKEVEIYKIEDTNIYVRFRIKHWLLGKYQYYVNHYFARPQENWATWTLDDNHDSDFASSVGFWRVYPVESHVKQSYVAYSANLLFKKRKSKFIRNRAIKGSLKQASSWVKRYSEAPLTIR